MKNKTHLKLLLAGALTLFTASSAIAGSEHDHGHQGEADHSDHGEVTAPNGGRMIESVDPHLEFFVTEDRHVQITFVDHDGKVVPVTDQSVSLIGGDRSNPTKVEFKKVEGRLVSTEALPAMAKMPIVLQVKASPDAKTIRERFFLNMSECSSCDHKEYACVCAH